MILAGNVDVQNRASDTVRGLPLQGERQHEALVAADRIIVLCGH